MAGLLRRSGYGLARERGEADILLVNTCGFIGPAMRESIDTIVELGEYRRRGRCRALVVTGCLSQRHPEELLAELPEVDAVVGTGEYPRLAEVLDRVLQGERVLRVGAAGAEYPEDLPRAGAVKAGSAYLKLAEGCERRCSFCTIPALRGPHRSRPPRRIVAEARSLVEQGARELVLISQDTTYYGRDLERRPALADLLRQLAPLEGLEWIRVMYAYPTEVTGQLLEAMATLPRVARYLDLPLQHASPRVLRAMRRGGDAEQLLRLLERVRRAVPGIVLRTTFMVGFPGESEADFAQLLDFMREAQFDHVGVFPYFQEEGTPAAEMAGQVPEEVKQERYRRAMECQQPIARRQNRLRVGKLTRVLVERTDGRRGTARGRWEGQAPEVDGSVYVRGAGAAAGGGEMLAVRITGVRGYDLVAEVAPPAG